MMLWGSRFQATTTVLLISCNCNLKTTVHDDEFECKTLRSFAMLFNMSRLQSDTCSRYHCLQRREHLHDEQQQQKSETTFACKNMHSRCKNSSSISLNKIARGEKGAQKVFRLKVCRAEKLPSRSNFSFPHHCIRNSPPRLCCYAGVVVMLSTINGEGTWLPS